MPYARIAGIAGIADGHNLQAKKLMLVAHPSLLTIARAQSLSQHEKAFRHFDARSDTARRELRDLEPDLEFAH